MSAITTHVLDTSMGRPGQHIAVRLFRQEGEDWHPVGQGKTDDEIKDALVGEYGGQVLALPENRGIDVWAYAVPVIGLVLGLLGVIAAIIVWRRRRPDDDEREDAPAPTEAEEDRLDKDMARFDL